MKNPGPRGPGFFVTGAATGRSEVIVDAEAQDVGAVAIVHAGDRKPAIRQVHVQIFAFDRPGWRDAIFRADAAGPARHDVALDRAAGLALQVAIGEAERAVDQEIIEGVAGAPAQGAEPVSYT